jgi:hypothetical protein
MKGDKNEQKGIFKNQRSSFGSGNRIIFMVCCCPRARVENGNFKRKTEADLLVGLDFLLL